MDALHSKAGAMLGEQSTVAVWLPMATILVPPHRIALESLLIAGRWTIQPDVINNSCTLYGARCSVIECLTR